MNTSAYVDQLVRQWQAEGRDKTYIVWNTAMACLGWSYVYSAWGAECTPSERRKRYNLCPGHETIRTKCKAFDGGSCSGCQWFPEGQRTRCFDCRGFTDWCLKKIGFDLYGDTCSSQWNCSTNWKSKGQIATMPRDTLCCLFVYKDGKWTHTGFGYNDETIECSSGVQYSSRRAVKWSHWAAPVCMEGDVPVPPTPTTKPTLRRGATGQYVVECQTKLISLGYSCGAKGADGIYGSGTIAAVTAFQKAKLLTADGVCGKNTWAALDKAAEEDQYKVDKTYSITIKGLDLTQANALLNNYPGSIVAEE